jgi:DNA gyrase subunit B
MVWDNKKRFWIFTHLLSDEYNLENEIYKKEQGDSRHHMDFNKLNNNPSNIVRLSREDHMNLHSENLHRTLLREDVKEKARQAHRTNEYREKMSNWARQPEVRAKISENSKKQWEDEEYKKYMVRKFKEFYDNNADYRKFNNKMLDRAQKEYWSNPLNRKKASDKVRNFYLENPDARDYLSLLAKEQWKDEGLREWRSEKTKEQWTPEFRKKRKVSYDKTYFNKTIKLMKEIYDTLGDLEDFDIVRINNNDKSILSVDTFCSRFFDGDYKTMVEAVDNYNHKIKKIIRLNEKIDVYDIEVPGTHNFALASGVFVHNSAKMGRDKEFQAILPMKGKTINVEKANPSKALSHEGITNLITAIGTGVRENFDISKLRYGRIVILSDADVDGQHITTLLLTFFYRYLPELIENGNLFIAVPPLYRIRKKKDYYVYNEDELKKMLEKLGKSEVTRFKGLSEMNPQQLWDTTLDPKKRILKKVMIEDAVLADETFSMLMGDVVGPRRKFIEVNADIAEVDM